MFPNSSRVTLAKTYIAKMVSKKRSFGGHEHQKALSGEQQEHEEAHFGEQHIKKSDDASGGVGEC